MNYEFVNFEITKNLFYKNAFILLIFFLLMKIKKKKMNTKIDRDTDREGKKKEQKMYERRNGNEIQKEAG